MLSHPSVLGETLGDETVKRACAYSSVRLTTAPATYGICGVGTRGQLLVSPPGSPVTVHTEFGTSTTYLEQIPCPERWFPQYIELRRLERDWCWREEG